MANLITKFGLFKESLHIRDIKDIIDGYYEALLFIEDNDESFLSEDENYDGPYTIYDFNERTQALVSSKIGKIMSSLSSQEIEELEEEMSYEIIGHNIYYSSSGQGSGFFDYTLDETLTNKLSGLIRPMIYSELEIDSRGKLNIRFNDEAEDIVEINDIFE